jgi:hypothetical protein
MNRNRIIVSTLFVAAGSAGCGMPDQPEITETTTQAALSAADVCTAVHALGSLDLGQIPGSPLQLSLDCQKRQASQLTYLGGMTDIAHVSTGASTIEDQALFCALRESHRLATPAIVRTGLSTFGMQTTLIITDADPATKTISGQRVGTLTAFGLGMPLESQSFTWHGAVEDQPQQQVMTRAHVTSGPSLWFPETIPHTVGVYEQANVTGYPWFLDASASFPIGNVTLSLAAHLHSMYRSLGGSSMDEMPFNAADMRAYSMAGTGSGQEATRKGTWTSFVNSCNGCTGSFCNCPTALDWDQELRQCGSAGCVDSYYTNLTDGRVPHENRRGGSGQIYFDGGGPVADWWHIGKPGPGARGGVIAGEPVHALSGSSADGTTAIGVGLGFDFNAGVADIAMNVNMDAGFRSGVAVREYNVFNPDAKGTTGNFNVAEVGGDAEAGVKVGARVVVNVDIPFFSGTVLDESFDILSWTGVQSGTWVPSSVTWYPGTGEAATMGTGTFALAPTATMASCLATPRTTNPAVQVNTPQDFLAGIKGRLPSMLHPCNIKICARSNSSSAGTMQNCNWTGSGVSCTNSGALCSCNQTSMDMCDNAGNIYHPKTSPAPVRSGCFAPPPK